MTRNLVSCISVQESCFFINSLQVSLSLTVFIILESFMTIEEMPDWTASHPLPSSDATSREAAREAGVEAEVIKMQAFFNNGAMEDEKSDKLKELSSDLLTERKSNIYYGLAFDKMLNFGTVH